MRNPPKDKLLWDKVAFRATHLACKRSCHRSVLSSATAALSNPALKSQALAGFP